MSEQPILTKLVEAEQRLADVLQVLLTETEKSQRLMQEKIAILTQQANQAGNGDVIKAELSDAEQWYATLQLARQKYTALDRAVKKVRVEQLHQDKSAHPSTESIEQEIENLFDKPAMREGDDVL